MTTIIRKEKCVSCSDGIVTFFKWDDDKIAGACNECGMRCNDKQHKLTPAPIDGEIIKDTGKEYIHAPCDGLGGDDYEELHKGRKRREYFEY